MATKAQRDELKRQRATRLRFAREAAGFTGPKEVADDTDWNINTYKSHENGIRAFTYEDAGRYVRRFKADAKGLTLDWLWTGTGPAPISSKSLRNLKKSEHLPNEKHGPEDYHRNHSVTGGDQPLSAGGDMGPVSFQRLADTFQMILATGAGGLGLELGKQLILTTLETVERQMAESSKPQEGAKGPQGRRKAAATS